jgi:hypothetical protein
MAVLALKKPFRSIEEQPDSIDRTPSIWVARQDIGKNPVFSCR